MTTGTLILIICGVILAQIAIGGVIGFYRRRNQYRGLGSTAGASEFIASHTTPTPLSAEPAEPSSAVAAWEGFKEFTVKFRVVEDSDSTICSFYLVPEDGQPLPSFRPGQFLTFKLALHDPVTRDDKTVVRCYSLSDSPRPDYYRVSIKRMPAPAGEPTIPAGVSSNFFHDHVHEGSRLWVKAPSGHFHLVEDEPLPIVLIGGGIGITPMLSILNSVLEGNSGREVWLFYGVRHSGELIMREQLQTLSRTYENFHLHICCSAPNKSDEEGVDYQHRGRVDIPLLRATLKLMRYQFYVCGPKSMMESIVPGLEAWGVASADIYYESFGPATLKKHKDVEPEASATHPITITFSRTGKSIPWDPSADSLLEFAEANEIEVESGCRAGSCGSCQTAINAGTVDYNQEPDADIAPGHCLLCISRPKGNITLDA